MDENYGAVLRICEVISEDALQRQGGDYNARDQDECSIHSGEAFILI